jgi:hypothetical protein
LEPQCNKQIKEKRTNAAMGKQSKSTNANTGIFIPYLTIKGIQSTGGF